MSGFAAELVSPFGVTLRRVGLPAGASLRDAAERLRASPLAVADLGGHAVRRTIWRRVKPKPGVAARFVEPPRGGTFRTVLLIAATAALAAAAGPFGAAVAGGIGFAAGTAGFALASGLAGTVLTVAGNLALNALFPPARPRGSDLGAPRRLSSIGSSRNLLRFGLPVPVILGRVRAAPDVAAEPTTYFLGPDQHLRLALCHGVGPLSISDVRVGETPLSALEDVESEHVEAFEAASHPLYARNAVEEALAVELEKSVAVSRFTAADTRSAALQFVAPQGLYGINPKGAIRNNPAELRIRYRLDGAGSWTTATFASGRGTIDGLFRNPRRRSLFVLFPSAGRWEVEVRRETDEGSDPKVEDWIKALSWTGLVSYQAGAPFAPEAPLAMTFLTVRATGQLSGTFDRVTALVASRCPAWSGSAWVADQETTNPADLFRYALQHPANRKAVADSAIDLAALQDWADYCRTKGWSYSRRIDGDETVRDILAEIAAAGRAVPTFKDGKHSVVFDEEGAGPVHHFNPANSRDFTVRRVWPDEPHALRVRFLDRTTDFTEQERIVYADGYSAANAVRVEEIEFPGVTDPAVVRKFARYWLAEMRLRPEEAVLVADWGSFDVTHGDRVLLSHDLISVGLHWARVKAVSGQTVTLDEAVALGAAGWEMTFRTGAAAAPVTRTIATGPATTATPTLSGSGTVPAVGAAVSVGPAEATTEIWRVKSVRRRDDLTAEIALVNDAPEIYLADDEEIPAWAPNLARPLDPRLSAASGGAALETLEADAGGPRPVVDLTWTPPPFGTPVSTLVRWRRAGGVFETLGTVGGGATAFRAVGLPAGAAEFEIAVEFAGFRGLSRPYRFAATLAAETRRPAAPTGARLTVDGRGATVTVAPPIEAWQARLAVRRSTAGSPVWETASPVIEVAGHVAPVPAGPGTWLVKWVSPFGVYSASAVSIPSGLGALAGVNVVETDEQAPGFAGTKTAMTVVGANLELDDTDTAGSYAFALPDLGEVFDARLTLEVEGGGFVRADDVALWPAVELIEEVTGVSDGDWSLSVFLRTTEDDPAGSPTWSAWAPFEAGDRRLRAAEVRIDVETADTNVGVLLSSIATEIDMPDRIESAGGVAVGSGGLSVSFGRPFRELRGVVLQVVGGAAGDYAEPSSEAVTGFTATVRSAAGTAKAGTINWAAAGYGARA